MVDPVKHFIRWQVVSQGIAHVLTHATTDENKAAETQRPLRVFFISAFSGSLRLFSQEEAGRLQTAHFSKCAARVVLEFGGEVV